MPIWIHELLMWVADRNGSLRMDTKTATNQIDLVITIPCDGQVITAQRVVSKMSAGLSDGMTLTHTVRDLLRDLERMAARITGEKP